MVKEILIAVGTDLPEHIFHVDQTATTPEQRKEEDRSVPETDAVVEHNQNESRKDHMDRQKDVKIVNDSKLGTDSQDKVNIGAQYTENRQECFDALAESQELWDRR